MNTSTVSVLLIDDGIPPDMALIASLRQRAELQLSRATPALAIERQLNAAMHQVALLFPAETAQPDDLLPIIRRLRRYAPTLPCILVMSADIPTQLAALRAGVFRVLPPAIKLEELTATILFAAEQNETANPAPEAHDPASSIEDEPFGVLKGMQRIATMISSLQEREEILLETCRAACQIFGADHSGLVLFDDGLSNGEVVAEYPSLGARGLQISVWGVPEEEQLAFRRKPVVVQTAGTSSASAPIRAIFQRFGICSSLLIPVISNNQVIGSFSIDTIGKSRDFWNGEIELGLTFAAHVAVAIERSALVATLSDQRDALQHTNHRMELLLQASTTVAGGANLRDSLAQLAHMLVQMFESSFCRAFLLDETECCLETRAFYPPAGAQATFRWHPRFGERISLQDWPELGELLQTDQPLLFDRDRPEGERLIQRWNGHLAIDRPLQALIMLPLRAAGRTVGLLDIGIVHRDTERFHADDSIRLAAAIAQQTAILIDRLQMYELTARHKRLLSNLNEHAVYLRVEKDPERLKHTIVRSAVLLLEGAAGGLCVYHQQIGELELVATVGLAPNARGRRQSHMAGTLGHVSRFSQAPAATRLESGDAREPMLFDVAYGALAAIPLHNGHNLEGVVFVLREDSRLPFDKSDLELLGRYGSQAAQALQVSQLISREQRAFDRLGILHQMSTFIQAHEDRDVALQVMLTVITAGYGLGLNRAAVLLLDEPQQTLCQGMAIGHLDAQVAEADWDDSRRRGLDNFQRYLQLYTEYPPRRTPLDARIAGLRPLTVGADRDDLFSQVLFSGKPRNVGADQIALLPRAFVAAFQPATPLVIAPLTTSDKPIGILVADNKFTGEPLTEELIEALLSVVSTASLTIDNHQLLRQARTASQRLRALYEASSQLLLSDKPHQVWTEIVERARVAAGARDVSVMLQDEPAHWKLINTDTTKSLQGDPRKIIRENGITMRVMHTGKPEVIEDAENEAPRVNPVMKQIAVRAAACLPIRREGRSIGVMWFHYDQPRSFARDEIDDMELYVNQAAIAHDISQRIAKLAEARVAAQRVAQMTVLGNLDTTLDLVADRVMEVLHCDALTLYTYDSSRNALRHPPVYRNVNYPDHMLATTRHVIDGTLRQGSFIHEMLQYHERIIVPDTSLDERFRDRPFTNIEGVRSCAVVPLRSDHEIIGILFVNYRKLHEFSESELADLDLFANQTTLAIRNAMLFTRLQRQHDILSALYEASRRMTTSLRDPQTTLQHIAEQAYRLLGDRERSGAFVLIALVERQQLTFTAGYPNDRLEQLATRIGRGIDLNSGTHGRIGITGRAVVTGGSIRVPDVSKHPDYIEYVATTRSELVVPICVDDQVIGVINLEHPQLDAFDEELERALRQLATQAAIAIQNAQLYQDKLDKIEELNRTQRRLTASTSVASIGMVASNVRHTIAAYTQTLSAQLELLERVAGARLEHDSLAYLQRLRTTIGDMQEQNKRIAVPLSHEHNIESVAICVLLRERLQQLLDNQRDDGATFIFESELDDGATVRASPEWLRRMFDILVDNAVNAMRGKRRRILRVAVQAQNDRAQIRISDTGRGVPTDRVPLLFKDTFRKEPGEKGMGIGLLLADMIVWTYGGDIALEQTGRQGSTFRLSLPLEYTREVGR